MAKTVEQQLEDVQSAIDDILTGDGATPPGQTIEIRGRTIDRADLDSLRFWKARLKKLKARKERGGVRVRRGVPLDS